ncbi:MAG: type II toxin-antitoxin system HigA family antitoxin [Acidobacteriota bacterium]
MKVRPIRTKGDYKAALEQIEVLWDPASGSEDADTLEVLSTIVEAYEDEHIDIPPPDPIEAILFRLEQSEMTRRDLQKILGVGRGRVSEVLSRKRGLSLGMIRKLVVKLNIPAETLIQPTRQRI